MYEFVPKFWVQLKQMPVALETCILVSIQLCSIHELSDFHEQYT